jgi:heme/copper-type cytochrome/quinol oxidase subunit 2
MTNITQSSFTCFVFNVAGIIFLVAAVLLVGYLVVSWLREGSQRRRIIGQEIIWTLVPALVVAGLVIMSEISRGAEKGQGQLADGRGQASMR